MSEYAPDNQRVRRRLTTKRYAVVWLIFVAQTTASVALGQSPADQSVNYQLQVSPPLFVPPQYPAAVLNGQITQDVVPTPTRLELAINADYMARAAVFGDDTRLRDFAQGNFLPSAIPVAGQPFFGSGARANLQGKGSAIRINGYVPAPSEIQVQGHAQLVVQNAGLTSSGASVDSNVTIREAFGRINRLSMGVMDTAFGDPAAEPETLDLAGPNARITVQSAGLGSGQGRLSYDLFSDAPDGFKTIVSVEQAQPQIVPVGTTATFARTPDFVAAMQYVNGDTLGGAFFERWHFQLASVFRDLGLEDVNGTNQNVFGWGTALSGSYRFSVNECLETKDRIMFSITYGEGISHYITDLNGAIDTNDAVVNGAGTLVPLPVLAWYVGYTHNWTDSLRSTVTYSQVHLDSVLPFDPAAPSPYRVGDYVAANLVFHRQFVTVLPGPPEREVPHNFYTGIEYLFGHKETLNGADGDAQRVMWVTSISN